MIAAVLAQIAPYDTDQIQNFGLRFLYWASICLGSWFTWNLINHQLEPKINKPYILVGSLVTFLMTLPLTLFIILVNILFLRNAQSPIDILFFWLQLIITSQSIYFLIYLIISQTIKSRNVEQTLNTSTPHFLKNIGGSLLYIKSEDHYLRIKTTAENKLILYKISDAIKQLDESHIEGMIIHRSHWVAKSAIKSHKKDGRKNLLILSNDEQLPVSTTYLKNLKSQSYI